MSRNDDRNKRSYNTRENKCDARICHTNRTNKMERNQKKIQMKLKQGDREIAKKK